jgi:hypothetical protein
MPNFQDDWVHSESAVLELDDIVAVVKAYYRRIWSQQMADLQEKPTVPNIHMQSITALARQLGIRVDFVRHRFEKLVRELIADFC